MYITSTNSLGDPVANMANFFSPYYGLTCADVYGSDGSSIAPQIFVWASEMTLSLEAPEANKSGAVHLGMFPVGSLSNTGSYTLNQLRSATFKTIDLKSTTTFSMSNSVVDHGIVGKSRPLASNAG